MNLAGQMIHQYEIKEQLGAGAMGSVYLALDTELDRLVALKLILSNFSDDPDKARRFREEARTLAALSHPNIPILYSYFIWEGKAVMVMEYVNGETLESMVRNRGPVPADVTVPLIRQALCGLIAAHAAGVVHRDLKPGNLMLNKAGVVKVVDFGIAKKLQVDVGLTGTNMSIGTPWYMSPEQILGKPLTTATDVYSMGIVLYEMLAGQVPFRSDSLYEVHVAHVQKVPDPPTIHYPHIPQEVVAAVMKALEKRPEDRFAGALEFMEALPQYGTGSAPRPGGSGQARPTSSPQPITAEEVKPATAPQPTAPLNPSPTVGLPKPIHVADIPTPPQPPVSHIAVTKPPVSQGPSKVLIAVASIVLILGIAGGVIWYLLNAKSARPEKAVVTPRHSQSSGNDIPDLLPPPEPETSTPGPSIASTPPPLKKTPAPVHSAPDEKTGTAKTLVVEHHTDAPPPQPPPAQTLSGRWRGTYTDSSAQARTSVDVELREANGSVSGSLSFVAADSSTGNCNLSGSSYNEASKSLNLLIHCSGPSTAPRFFNAPTSLRVESLADTRLSGHVQFSRTPVTVDLQRLR